MTYLMSAVFESESGRQLSYRQIGFASWKQGIPVERVENGFLVNGERYEHISD